MIRLFFRLLHGLLNRYYRQRFADISQKDITRDIFAGEISQPISWPNSARFAFNLNFDDYSAKSLKNSRYDYGGSVGEGVNKILTDLLDQHPELKTTLFVVPNARFLNQGGIFYGRVKDDRYSLDRPECTPLAEWFHIHSPQIEVATHGYDHLNPKTGLFLAPAEFELMSNTAEIHCRLYGSWEIFKNIGIEPKGFRPPMWGIGHNSNLALLRQLVEEDFTYVSCSSPLSGLNWDKKRVSNIYPEYFITPLHLTDAFGYTRNESESRLLNLPQNVSLIWPLEKILSTIDRIAEMGGLVSLMGHANAEDAWMEDGLGPRNIAKIEAILAHLAQKYPGQVWFATLAEIAEHYRKSTKSQVPNSK